MRRRDSDGRGSSGASRRDARRRLALLLATTLATGSCHAPSETGEGDSAAWPDGSDQVPAVDLRVDADCAACHGRIAADVRLSSHRGRPGASDLGCRACHGGHDLQGGVARSPAGLRASCESCHPEAVAEFRRPFRHPLGVTVSCTSCHEPHGGPRREAKEALRHDACVECHSELRGPFVYPHEGNHSLGCLSCHEPHGSGNRRLLTHADTRMLCFSCHTFLELIHIQEPGSRFRQCLACHTEIHGSNWDKILTR